MKILKTFILFTSLLLYYSCNIKAQTSNIIQVKGMVVNIHFVPISYVHILIKNKKTGTISDENGKFDFFAEKGDTLQFSCVGFKKRIYTIPTITTSRIYYVVAVLKNDTTILQEVVILPWKNYKEFKKIFLISKVPDDDIVRAEKNLELMQLQMLLNDDDIPAAPGAAYNISMQQRSSQLYWKGQTQPMQIFNVIAWQQFFEYLKEGKFKRTKKKVK
ncbi:MAG: carboxypeptidase-like regulatory domain-containing protein [Bacteroidia bacterium]|nr:carboxypeptidase-like regulatory domain-containing protein [Bacteroidia bacterium]